MGKDCCRRKKTKDPRRVKLSSKVDEVSICGESGGVEDTTITLTKSEERYRSYMNDADIAKNEVVMRENGWCLRDGTPWGSSPSCMPKDEAALLKKGIVDKNGARLTYCEPEASDFGQPRFFDEVELLKEGLVDKKGRHVHLDKKSSPPQMPSQPISIAELNSRGFLDNNGKLHFNIQSLAAGLEDPKSPKITIRDRHDSTSICSSNSSDFNVTLNSLANSETKVSFSPNRPIIEQKRSETSSKTGIPTLSPSVSGRICCEAGPSDDRAVVNYTVTRDGRNYELKTHDGHAVNLEFNKKHAYLTVS